MVGFIIEALPDDAQKALSTLQSDAPPMAPELAAQVVTEELGPPHEVFLDWSDMPVAAASVGQVHRAVTRDGRVVAVKVQYPGIEDVVRWDLDVIELLANIWARLETVIDFRPIAAEMRRNAPEEVDFQHEGRAATWLFQFRQRP